MHGHQLATASTTATFSDPPLFGYVLVRKNAADTGRPLAGATFSIAPGKITGSGSNSSDNVLGVTNHDGYYCVDNLRMTNTYTVTETTPLPGHGLPAQTSQGNLSPTLGSCTSVSCA